MYTSGPDPGLLERGGGWIGAVEENACVARVGVNVRSFFF